jgi:hypothetical protein
MIQSGLLTQTDYSKEEKNTTDLPRALHICQAGDEVIPIDLRFLPFPTQK